MQKYAITKTCDCQMTLFSNKNGVLRIAYTYWDKWTKRITSWFVLALKLLFWSSCCTMSAVKMKLKFWQVPH